MNRCCLALGFVAAFALTAGADRVILRDGKVISGTVTGETATRVCLRVTDTISVDLRREEIARVVREDSPVPAALPRPVAVATTGAPPRREGGRDKTVCFAQISGPVESRLVVSAVERACARAVRQGADLVVFEIDTPGGRLDLLLELCALIERLGPTPTVGYVGGGASGGAYSAGAVLALTCGRTFMAPGTAIGAAAPVRVTGRGGVVDEKQVSAIRAKVRSLAQKNGYPPELAEAMVDADLALREARVNGQPTVLATTVAAAPKDEPDVGPWITTRGKLLTLTAEEAERYGLAARVVASRQELLAALDLAGCRVVDLRTAQAVAEALERRQRHLARLEQAIAAWDARVSALDPRRRGSKSVIGYGTYGATLLGSGGGPKREEVVACVRAVELCLRACREKLAFAGDHPDLNIPTQAVEAKVTSLIQLREQLLATSGLK